MKSKYRNLFISTLSVFILMFSTTIFATEAIKHDDNILQKIDSLLKHTPDSSQYDELVKMIEKYRQKGDYVSTIVAINKALSLFSSPNIDDDLRRKLIILKVYLGQSYNGLGLFSESIKYNTEVLLFAREKKDTILSITSLMILGEAYVGLGVNDKAIKHMLEANNEAKRFKVYDFLPVTLNNLSTALIEINELDRAMTYLNQLEKYVNENEIKDSHVYLSKCTCLLQQGKTEEALTYCKLFETEINLLHNFHIKTSLYQEYAEIYLKLEDIDTAEQYVLKAIGLAKKHKFNDVLIQAYKVLSKIYTKKQNSNRATYYQDQYLQLNDSITSLNMRTAIGNVRLLSDIEQNKSKISKLKAENELKLIKIKTLVLSLVAVLVIGLFVYYQRRLTYKAYKKVVKENIKAIETHDEIVSLRKIVVHDTRKKVFSDEIIATLKEANNQKDSVNLTPQQSALIESQIRSAFDVDEVFLNKDLDLSGFANDIGTNRVYLSYVFNHVIKQSFNEMLNTYRINRAKKLLLTDSDKFTIEAIGLQSGFSNKVTFNRNFKSITGVTPSVFVKISQEHNESFSL